MPLPAPARGWDQLYLLADAKPKEGHAWESSGTETVFQGSVKTVGCFPGDKLDYAWDPARHVAGAHVPEHQHRPAPLPGPGLGLDTALAAPARGWDRLDLLANANPKEGREWGSTRPKTVF